MKKLLAIIALSAATAPALAAERPYLGVDAQYNSVELADGALDFQPTSAMLRAGSILTEHLGLEAQIAASLDDDTVDSPLQVSLKVRNRYSFLGFYRLGMGRGGLSIYGGYSYSLLRLETPGFPAVKEDEDGLSYGAALDFPLFKGFNLEAEYLVVRDKDDAAISNMGVGLRRYF